MKPDLLLYLFISDMNIAFLYIIQRDILFSGPTNFGFIDVTRYGNTCNREDVISRMIGLQFQSSGRRQGGGEESQACENEIKAGRCVYRDSRECPTYRSF